MSKKIIACILVATLLLVFLEMLSADVDLSDDEIYVDDKSVAKEINQQQLYEELFDLNSVIGIDIDISRDELAKIQMDYESYKNIDSKSPIYRKADSVTFTINGKKYVIKEVGVRMKGNFTRTKFYNDFLGVYNLVSFRLSFNETFDDTSYYQSDAKKWGSEKERNHRKERTFATLEKLEVKWNSTFDNTYVRNIYASDMFQDYGILAQRCNLSSFTIGGFKSGIYKIFEPVDDIFLDRYLPEKQKGGDLYKCNWADGAPADLNSDNTFGITDKDIGNFYTFDLKTNKKVSTHFYLKRLLDVINDKNVTSKKLENVVDMDYFLKFCALNYLMGNQDDMRNNYNNYYIYFRPNDGKAIFIPYDCERCFGCVYAWNPTGSGMSGVSPYSDLAEGNQSPQTNPLINMTVTEDGWYKDEYTKYLFEINRSKWMITTHFESYYETARENYSDSIISNLNYFSTLNHNLEFSMQGGSKYNDNLSVSDFMRQIKHTLNAYTQNAG